MPDPSLNERAAKCMGWMVSQPKDIYRGKCITGQFTMADPANYLDDAALVRDKAIEVCGWDVYYIALCNIVSSQMEDGYGTQHLVCATPAQITEAACRCLEAATPPSP